MKRIVLTLLAFFLILTGASAQETERIEGRAYLYGVDSLRLDSMYAYWNDFVAEHPKDEVAWRNLSEVEQAKVNRLLYKTHDWHAPQLLRKQLNVIPRMQQAIPGSYTFYYCAHQGGYVSEEESKKMEESGVPTLYSHLDEYADSAIAVLPKKVPAGDYDLWTGYLIQKNDTLLLTKVLTQYYESGLYPEERLQYNFNELQGMEDGGVYLGHTEGDIIGKLILQYVLRVHQDKILYHENLAMTNYYLKTLFNRIGIPFSNEIYSHLFSVYQKDMLPNIMRYIFENSKRPVYLSAHNIQQMVLGKGVPDELKACLYNEGLTMRYSAKPYDNMDVKRRNVEQRYRLEYLRMRFHPEVKSNQRFSFPADALAQNYLNLLHDLLPYYKQHNKERYQWLRGFYTDIIAGLEKKNYDVEKFKKYLK